MARHVSTVETPVRDHDHDDDDDHDDGHDDYDDDVSIKQRRDGETRL